MKLPDILRLPVCLGLLQLAVLNLSHTAEAGSATWSANPATSNWNLASNWNPNTVPNGASDVATFDFSNTTSLSLSAKTTVDSIVFAAGASAYSITASKPLNISGAGISNSSGLEQTLVAANNSETLFLGSATLDAGVTLFVTGPLASGNFPGAVGFFDSSSAGEAMIINSRSAGPFLSGTDFFDNSTAGNALIINQGGIGPSESVPGSTQFLKNSNAGTAQITCDGQTGNTNFGGASLSFEDNSSAANATITINGGNGSGTQGGICNIYSGQTANSTLIANGGVNGGGGGTIVVRFSAAGAFPQVELSGNGNFNLAFSATIGSLEGDGPVFLSSHNLAIGGNGLSTTYSGVIQDNGVQMGTGGSLTKTGPETLTLTGASLYTGGTTVNEGVLVVANQSGSGTGTAAVQVNGGTLGGGGMVAGSVTIGTGSGGGAFLAPGVGSTQQATFTTQSSVTFKSDAAYTYTAKARGHKARTDRVVANGVTINEARFRFRLKTRGALEAGTVLTAISNTAVGPIAGTFGNLANGAIISAAGNNFMANYQGGDGNDLTLTVVP